MTKLLKYPMFVTLSLIINILLFLLIHYLVTNEIHGIKHFEKLNWVDLIQLQQQKNTVDKQKEQSTPDKPPPPEKIPEVPEFKQPDIPNPPTPDIPVQAPSVDLPLSAGTTNGPFIGNYLEPANNTSLPDLSNQLPKIATDLSPVNRVEPVYPPRALRAGLEGTVTVEFTITTDGNVKDLKIVSADPPDIFNKSVLKAVAKWKFAPQMINGTAVEQRARQDIKFTLKR